MPNLIIIDGGKNQLKAALSMIEWTIPIISIAKKPERLMIPLRATGKIETIELKSSWPVTKLLLKLRDESHRVAINYHKKLRQKAFIF